MEFDLNEATDAVEALLPWELKLKVDGQVWPTRRPTVADIAGLQAIGDLASAAKDAADPKNAASAQRFFDRVENMFEDPKPPLREWRQDHIAAALVAYLCYFNGQTPKKIKAIAASVKAAMAGQ